MIHYKGLYTDEYRPVIEPTLTCPFLVTAEAHKKYIDFYVYKIPKYLSSKKMVLLAEITFYEKDETCRENTVEIYSLRNVGQGGLIKLDLDEYEAFVSILGKLRALAKEIIKI